MREGAGDRKEETAQSAESERNSGSDHCELGTTSGKRRRQIGIRVQPRHRSLLHALTALHARRELCEGEATNRRKETEAKPTNRNNKRRRVKRSEVNDVFGP